MPHMGVREVHDALFSGLEVVSVPVNRWNPAERLMRWRNVVAIGGEDDDGIADAAQIDSAAVANANFTLLQLIADEEIFDDGNHLFSAKPIVTAPPAFKFEKALTFAIDVGKEIGVFFPYGLCGLQRLKILRKPSPVKPAIA